MAPKGSCTIEDWPSSTTMFAFLLSRHRLTENDKSQRVSFADQRLAFRGGYPNDAKRALRSGDVRNAYSAEFRMCGSMADNMGWQVSTRGHVLYTRVRDIDFRHVANFSLA